MTDTLHAAQTHPSTPPMLEVRDVHWCTPSAVVLDRISFSVAPGEFVALMGRNGAGKSTLLDLVGGIRPLVRGEVVLSGRPLPSLSAAERAPLLAHLPQQVRAERTLLAESLVAMGRYGQENGGWFETDADRAVIEDVMRRCDCLHFRRRPLGTLSGGERQRVILAACLAQQSRLMLLDEPATFLDVDQQLHCFEVLRAEADRGIACVAVTHDINLALTFCTRLIVLADGNIAHDTGTDTALDAPDWLRFLSRRMSVDDRVTRRPMVRYQ
jgi:iron complex transport system ATP-binding protein